jgi:MPBQ/MSBQ methyltransferase
MRDAALELAALDRADLDGADVGAGTGFDTEGIVRHGRARTRDDDRPEPAPARPRTPQAGAAAVAKHLGDAEQLPLETDRYDRYVSTGSIEYWPDPQARDRRGLTASLRPVAVALLAGPLTRSHPLRPPAVRHLDALPRRARVPATGSSGRASRDPAHGHVAPA